MALIDDIISKIEALPIKDGKLTMSISDFTGMDFMAGFFNNVLKETSLTLTGDPTKTPGTETISVTGTADLFGYADLGLDINFSVQNKEVVGSVKGTFDPGKTLNLPVLTWIKVSDIFLETSISETYQVVGFAFGLKLITTENNKVPIVITSMANDQWRLDVAEDMAKPVSTTELIGILGGDSLESFIPEPLAKILDNLVLNGLETIFNTKTKSINYFTASIAYEKGWDIAPKVSLLPGLQMAMTIINADDKNAKLLTANVQGTFKVAGVEVPILVGTSMGGTTVWSFGIQPGKSVQLPSFSDLLDLADTSDLMPSGLSNLPSIDIETLRIDFDSTKSVLTKLDFAISTAEKWTIIDKYFEIDKIAISFQITDLTVSASRQVYGSLYGLFTVAEVDLFCSLQKTQENPDWTIKAGLPPGGKLDITALAKQLLEPQITLPNDLPTIDFTTLEITVVPDKKTFEFEAGSTNTWTLIDKKLSIDSFNLDFKKDPANAPNDITGSIATTLDVCDVHIDLSASLNNTPDGGWFFEGKTKKGDVIKIGEFITYLTDKFSIPEPPEWIQSITLKDIEVSLNTKTKDFTFQITADATISDKDCELVISFALTHDKDKGTYKAVLTGTLTVDKMEFKLNFETGSEDTLMSVIWNEAPDKTLNLQDLAEIFGSDDLVKLVKNVPSNMDIALESLSFTYDFTNNQLVLSAVSKNYGHLVFVADKIKTDWVFIFLLSMDKIDLTKLPLIGNDIGKLGKFEIDDFNLLVCSGEIILKEIQDINKLINAAAKEEKTTLPTLPENPNGLKAGINLQMTFVAPTLSIPVDVGTANAESGQKQEGGDGDSSPTQALVMVSNPSTSGNDVKTQNGYWINVQKSVGPIYMDKIGFAYANGDIEILFNFSMKLGTLNITLDGLAVGTPLSKIDPHFGLKGLSVTFNSGPVEISGGFIKSEVDGVTEYNGEAMLKVATFALSAMGSYAKYDGETSLFIFALITAPPLGGPPYLFVTGVAAGFGYNRGLKLPDISEVSKFPLVSGFVPDQSSPFSSPDPGAALEVLVKDNVVPIQIGQNWVAAGISFTSFEMLQSFALLVVEFGTSLEIALIGMTTASIPKGDPRPLIYAELGLEVRILPDEGLIAVEAQLQASSYLLDTSCHLTGGFAFYVWFGSNPNAGDFVVTLGGYHPNFVPPSYYPKVPRLGFNWIVTSELTIKGGMYFALTPTCLMAGGMLQAVWQSGNLKAWFVMGANFLIAWKPYHYEAEMYLSFGVSYTFHVNLLFAKVTKTISVSLGADLSVWGPSFSGVAHIHLWIVSFTVHFGSESSQAPKPISWTEFENSFFPASKPDSDQTPSPSPMLSMYQDVSYISSDPPEETLQVSGCKVTEGLIKDLAQGEDNPDDINWLVRPHGTVIDTSSIIPAKTYNIVIKGKDGTPIDPAQIIINNENKLKDINVDFGVGPVDVDHDDFDSSHNIEIVNVDNDFSTKQVFYFTPIIQDAPKAMWLNEEVDLKAKTQLITNVLIGFEISNGEIAPDETPWVDVKLLETSNNDYSPILDWASPKVVSGPNQPSDPIVELEQTILAPPARAGILSSLVSNGFDVDSTVDVQYIAKEASDFLLAPPQYDYTYWKAS